MKILVLDIETAPLIGYAWGTYQTNIIEVIEPKRVLCFAAKWVGEKGMRYFSEYHDGHDTMIVAAWNLLNEADAVVHYNGASFDVPHLNQEFALAGLEPPEGYVQLDLLLTVRKRFNFDKNRLGDITEAFGLEGKAKHEGFGLWRKCLAGDDEAWADMRRYNKQDVKVTEALYHRILPWIPNHPNLRLYDGSTGQCPTCGSDGLQRRGFAYTKVSKFVKYQCTACGKYFRAVSRIAGVNLTEVSS